MERERERERERKKEEEKGGEKKALCAICAYRI
jgi:hypothetical protein